MDIELKKKLTGCMKAVYDVLRGFPNTRDLSGDQFIARIRFDWDQKWSAETITRSRRKVQNTWGLYPRKKDAKTWEEEVGSISVDEIGQTSFLGGK